MSNSVLRQALGRLRKTFNGDLFYRSGQEMRPTVFAVGLSDTIIDSLRTLEKGIDKHPRFKPAQSHEQLFSP
ncbi:hypothetical protein [Acerihabitans arboris]|uniref:hypothetical protein n=1 Tax=Acerihabitans arboris TaxID=2691583 RepID=UPI001FE841A1|nr:hypothetical protein [Acerihabitans arboris]